MYWTISVQHIWFGLFCTVWMHFFSRYIIIQAVTQWSESLLITQWRCWVTDSFSTSVFVFFLSSVFKHFQKWECTVRGFFTHRSSLSLGREFTCDLIQTSHPLSFFVEKSVCDSRISLARVPRSSLTLKISSTLARMESMVSTYLKIGGGYVGIAPSNFYYYYYPF